MREYLFRAKRIDTGEWVEGLLCYTKFSCALNTDMNEQHRLIVLNNDREWFYAIQRKDNLQSIYEVIPATIGQFSGLHDKNGKRVFEGDIIQCWRSVGKNGELRGKYVYPLPVIYADLWCQFVAYDEPNKLFLPIYQSFDAFEVISTISDKEVSV